MGGHTVSQTNFLWKSSIAIAYLHRHTISALPLLPLHYSRRCLRHRPRSNTKQETMQTYASYHMLFS